MKRPSLDARRYAIAGGRASAIRLDPVPPLFHPLAVDLSLEITAFRAETGRIGVFELRAADGAVLPGWQAGAHLDFDLGPLGLRSYSLIDWQAPAGPPTSYTIAVQREDEGDGGSKRMHALAVGDRLPASLPRNDFPLEDGPAVLIAGGIGVTPLIPMAATLMARGADFSFHYACRSRAVQGFGTPLRALLGDRLAEHFDDERMIDLGAVCGGLAPVAHLYICGPRGMIEAGKAAAEAAGHPSGQIHFELFATPVPEAGDTAFEVEIADGQVFTIPPGRTIIEVLEEAGIDLIYDCQRGDCGICQTDVIEGEPDHRDVVLSEAERDSGKVMQICVSRARSGRLVLDL